jgi:hypothetical protein
MAISPATIAERARRDDPLTRDRVGRIGYGDGWGPHWWWWPVGGGGGGRGGDGAVVAAISAVLLGFLGTAIYGARAMNTLEEMDDHSALVIEGRREDQQVVIATRIKERYVRYYQVETGLAGFAAVACVAITLAGLAALAGYGSKRPLLLEMSLRSMSYSAMAVGGLTMGMFGHWIVWQLYDRRANARDAQRITDLTLA